VNRRFMMALSALALFSILLFGGIGSAHAAGALEVVKEKQTALFQALKQSPPNQKKVQATFDEMLEYSALAEASLGGEWGARSQAEKDEFASVLKQLVQKAYERNLKKTLAYRIEYLGEEGAGDSKIVKTRAVSGKNAREEPIEIDFKMIERNGSWKVGDIVTDGTSLVANWRVQFIKIIKKDGFPVLMKKMRDKLAKNEE
jgi:phospholipid transport system substrate-binding protein